MPTVNTSVFDDAVSKFKSDLAANPNLITYGQFYVTDQTEQDLVSTVESRLKSNAFFNFLPGAADEINRTMTFLNSIFTEIPVSKIDVNEISKFFNDVEKGHEFDDIRPLFVPDTPTPADVPVAWRDFQRVWFNTDIGVPFLGGYPTMRTIRASFNIEKSRCFDVARRFADKLLHKRKIKTLDQKLRISAGQIARPVVQEEKATGKQTIIYNDQKGLAKMVKTMRDAIANQAIVQCGVLSGVRQDANLFRQPEHYVLAFAADTIDGKDAFLFWDPDASVSNLVLPKPWGKGFGCLFATGGRLSTAIDDSDLNAIVVDSNADDWGDHLNAIVTNKPKPPKSDKTKPHERRHRYQVYYVQTLPV